jgi:hypothetical protein
VREEERERDRNINRSIRDIEGQMCERKLKEFDRKCTPNFLRRINSFNPLFFKVIPGPSKLECLSFESLFGASLAFESGELKVVQQ